MSGYEHPSNEGCILPIPPVALDAVTQCAICHKLYQAVIEYGALRWVPLLSLPKPEQAGPEVTDPFPTLVGDMAIGIRCDLVHVSPDVKGPLIINFEEETVILVQTKEDQAANELGLNIVTRGSLGVELVAWILARASESLLAGVAASRPQPEEFE